MRLTSLRVRGWRNLSTETLRPGPRATVLSGFNGQGKTNWIEALYCLIAFRSFRTTSNDDLIGWGQDEAKVAADIETGGLDRKIEVDVSKSAKAFRLDGKRVRRDAPALSAVSCVLFVPDDLLLPRASPSERRRFVDLVIFGTDRSYYKEAQTYQKLVRSRNVILKHDHPCGALLDTLDEQVAQAGAVVIEKRRKTVQGLAPKVTRLFAEIHDDLQAEVRYVGHETLKDVPTKRDALAQALLRGLQDRRALDIRRRFGGYGPHTDDLYLGLLAHPARDHGSQGQLRSLVLALKLAELELISECNDEPPVLLLDDVASELDIERRKRLFQRISELPGQSLITVTDAGSLPALPDRVDFSLDRGALHPM